MGRTCTLDETKPCGDLMRSVSASELEASWKATNDVQNVSRNAAAAGNVQLEHGTCRPGPHAEPSMIVAGLRMGLRRHLAGTGLRLKSLSWDDPTRDA